MLDAMISRVQSQDLEDFSAHCVRQMKELTDDGGFAHPFSPDHIWNEEDFAEKLMLRWSLPEMSPNWEIAWKLVVDGKVVGHCSLKSHPLASAWHRVKLGMGIEEAYRGHGYGRALLATAVLWARTQSRLNWIDLEVFESNHRALRLYKRFGFEEQGIVPDAYRIKGESVSNVLMALRLQ